MIAVDAMVIVAAVLDGNARLSAEAWRRRDPRWMAPPLWRSEVRNVLTSCARRQRLTVDTAYEAMVLAELLMTDGMSEVESAHVLRLAHTSGCTAYDCEYVAVAEALGVQLLTADRQVLAAFPGIAVPFEPQTS